MIRMRLMLEIALVCWALPALVVLGAHLYRWYWTIRLHRAQREQARLRQH